MHKILKVTLILIHILVKKNENCIGLHQTHNWFYFKLLKCLYVKIFKNKQIMQDKISRS